MASTQQPTSARLARKGKKSGPVTEYCALWHIKPGHAQQIIDEISTGLASRGDVREMYKKIGVHDARYVVLDDGKRLLITISFDLDFDPYFDDAIAGLVGGDKSQIAFRLDESSRGSTRRRLRLHVLGRVQELADRDPDGSRHLRQYQ